MTATNRYESRGKIYDVNTVLSYSHTFATANLTGKTSAGATGNYVDLGAEVYTSGKVVFDVTSIVKPVAGSCFRLELRGGKTSAFTSAAPLAFVEVGDSAANEFTRGLTEDKGIGRYTRPFDNQYGNELYRYLGVIVRAGATLSTGIVFSSFITK